MGSPWPREHFKTKKKFQKNLPEKYVFRILPINLLLFKKIRPPIMNDSTVLKVIIWFKMSFFLSDALNEHDVVKDTSKETFETMMNSLQLSLISSNGSEPKLDPGSTNISRRSNMGSTRSGSVFRENLKKSRQNNSWNQINQKKFSVKLHFWQF